MITPYNNKRTLNVGLLFADDDPDYAKLGSTNLKILITNIANDNGIKIKEIENCKLEECDLVLYSQYSVENYLCKNNLEVNSVNIKSFFDCVKGDPKFLMHWIEYNNWPLEHDDKKSTFEIFTNIKNVYTLSFNDSNDHNLFFPYVVGTFYDIYDNIKIQNTKDILNTKTDFCAYVSSNLNTNKENIFNIINNIRHVHHYGHFWQWDNRKLDNINLQLDESDAVNVLHKYKFILCIENTRSTTNPSYITEKIARGYINNCVPIYWGCTNASDIFNEKSFINITNLSESEIIEKITYYDNNDEAYLNMLNEYPFRNKTINYNDLFDKSIEEFLIKYVF